MTNERISSLAHMNIYTQTHTHTTHRGRGGQHRQPASDGKHQRALQAADQEARTVAKGPGPSVVLGSLAPWGPAPCLKHKYLQVHTYTKYMHTLTHSLSLSLPHTHTHTHTHTGEVTLHLPFASWDPHRLVRF